MCLGCIVLFRFKRLGYRVLCVAVASVGPNMLFCSPWSCRHVSTMKKAMARVEGLGVFVVS